MFRKVQSTLGTMLPTSESVGGCRCDSAATWTPGEKSPPAYQKFLVLKATAAFEPQGIVEATVRIEGNSGAGVPRQQNTGPRKTRLAAAFDVRVVT
jgi:hypothetical protein